MMKRTTKQLLGLTLSVAMLMGMAGCGNEATTNTETQVASKETETTATPSVTETPAAEDEEITYPLDTDITISLWTHRLTLDSTYSEAKESPFHVGLAKNTGVDIEWMFPAPGQGTSAAYNLLLTEDELPYVIFKSYGVSDLEQLYADGVIYDLTEYLPKYAPDYWAAINSEEYENVKKSVVSSDGKFLSVAAMIESDYNKTYIGPVIRQDWLDECGLKAPVTVEDWEKVLTTFKDKYNAVLAAPTFDYTIDYLGNMTGAHGGTRAVWYVDPEAETIQLAQTDEEWVEFIKVLNKWYEAGLIDNDTFGMDANALRTKVANNQVGVSIGPMSQITNWIADAESTGNGAKWVGFTYPRTEPGATVHASNTAANNLAGNSNAVITTSCPEEDLITVLKFLNYGYTEEGMMYYNFGDEGVSYTLDAKGEPQWTDLVLKDESGLNGAAKKYTGASSAPIGIQMSKFVAMKNSDVVADAVNIWIENNDASKYECPSLARTEEENLIYTDKFAAILTYVRETSTKFVTGEMSIEDDLDEFYAELDKMGLKECTEVQQAAYDRYLAK